MEALTILDFYQSVRHTRNRLPDTDLRRNGGVIDYGAYNQTADCGDGQLFNRDDPFRQWLAQHGGPVALLTAFGLRDSAQGNGHRYRCAEYAHHLLPFDVGLNEESITCDAATVLIWYAGRRHFTLAISARCRGGVRAVLIVLL
jgi:hypothetical protein